MMRIAPTAITMMLLAVAAAPPLGTLGDFGGEGGLQASRPASVTFTNVSVAAGLSGLSANFLAWGDYDRDGFQDILVQGSRLFRNNGPPGWNFTEVTAAAGLSGGFTSGTWGDYDNDGWLDFYAAGGADRLCRNNGNGTFSDVTMAAGNVSDASPSTASGWGDYDRDGDIDLYVTGGETMQGNNFVGWHDTFWRNDGDGTFTNATLSANLSEGNHPYYGRGVAWGDFNNDGWPDIYISNYRLSPNYLYVNNQNGTFTERGKELDCAGVYDMDRYYDATTARYWGPQWGHTIGSAWADFDNNGDLDLWTTNLVHKYVGPTGDPNNPYDIRGYVCDDSKMYRNSGAPFYNFTDIRSSSGIATKPIGGSGVYKGDELFDGLAWADYDNDGDQDIWIPQVYDLDYSYSYLYEQDGGGNGSCHWTDRALELGMRVWNTYAGVWCDYDNDGDQDLLTAGKSPFVAVGQGTYQLHLFRNSGNSNHWLRVNLLGGDCNRAAIGARVTVSSGNITQMREVEGGMGCHGSQNSLVQQFGFLDRTRADWVEVQWPCGRIERFSDVGLNQTLNITESALPVPKIVSASASPNPASEDVNVAFSATASVQGGSIQKYEWDFTSDNTYDAEGANAQHTYTENGTYLARLRVWSSSGIGAKGDPIFLNVTNLPPVADAGADRSVVMDSMVSFDASGSTDTPSDLALGLHFNWSFGDGSSRNWSRDPIANHTYTGPGAFNVRLSVRDDDYAEDVASVNITVSNPAPAVGALADILSEEDRVVVFTGAANDTPTDRPRLSFKWDFGDGNSTAYGPSPGASHSYTRKGNYTAIFFAKDPGGIVSSATLNVTVLNPAPSCTIGEEYCNRTAREDITLGFDGSGTDNPSDLPALVYRWDFGDGNCSDWSPSISALHGYSTQGVFNVTLTVKDDDFDTGSAKTTVRISDVLPSAEMVTQDQTIEEDSVLELEGKGEDTASDQASLEYRWDFGDGNRSEWNLSPTANITYPAAGRYRITLMVRDDEFSTAASDPVFITVVNLPPRAVAAASAKNVDEDMSVNFTAMASTDTPSDISSLSYQWDFGDGDDAEGSNASHTYQKAGSYTVKLNVVDNDGAASEDSALRIKVRNLPPVAAAASDRTSAKTGEKIGFSANGTDTPSDILGLRFSWDFGDGARAEGRNVIHTYTVEGRYNVRLEVTDPDGEKGEAQLAVDISSAKNAAAPPAGGPSIAIVAGVAAVAIIGSILLVLLFWNRGRRQ